MLKLNYLRFPVRTDPSTVPLATVQYAPWGMLENVICADCFGFNTFLSMRSMPRGVWLRLFSDEPIEYFETSVARNMVRKVRLGRGQLPVEGSRENAVVMPPIRFLDAVSEDGTPLFTLYAPRYLPVSAAREDAIRVFSVNTKRKTMLTDRGMVLYEYRGSTNGLSLFLLPDQP